MISVRTAEVDDALRIQQLNENEFGYKYPLDKTTERLAYILTKPTDRIFVICEKNLVLGYVHACNYEGTYFDSQKNIMAIAVDSKYRGRGLGRKLLDAVENWAKEDGCAGVRLVSGMNREEAHKFYECCGYRLRKTQRNYIKLFTIMRLL